MTHAEYGHQRERSSRGRSAPGRRGFRWLLVIVAGVLVAAWLFELGNERQPAGAPGAGAQSGEHGGRAVWDSGLHKGPGT